MVEAAEAPGLAIIAGSGMGDIADRLATPMKDVESIAFDRIEGVGACTVDGHRGEVLLGRLHHGSPRCEAGRRIALVLGRRHVYEGAALGMAGLMGWLAGRGFSDVVAVSAAGSLRGTILPGELVIVSGIIDIQNRDLLQPALRRLGAVEASRSPAGGSVRERAGGGRRAAVSARLAVALEAAARRAGVGLRRGVLACGAGPAYETPAEVRALQAAGADVATMSAAPEVQYAAELGMDIAIVAAVTNRCTGIGSESPGHERVLEVARSSCGALADLMLQFI